MWYRCHAKVALYSEKKKKKKEERGTNGWKDWVGKKKKKMQDRKNGQSKG